MLRSLLVLKKPIHYIFELLPYNESLQIEFFLPYSKRRSHPIITFLLQDQFLQLAHQEKVQVGRELNIQIYFLILLGGWFMVIFPASLFKIPQSIRMRVVLPAPLGPKRPNIWPLDMLSEILLMTFLWENFFTIFSIFINHIP